MTDNLIYEYFPTPNSRNLYRRISIGLVGSIFKLLSLRHNLNLINTHQLLEKIAHRDKRKPLLTLMNHGSMCDETFVFGNLLPIHILTNSDMMRWTLAAYDVLYTNPTFAKIFYYGQCIPVWRNVRCRESGDLLYKGLGVNQLSMNFALDIINRGGWLNLFPQGRIIYEYEKMKEETVRLRWGIGRLYCESKEKPCILPVWHCGLDQVCPVVKPYFLHSFLSNIKKRKVTIMVGEEIQLPEKFSNLPSCEESWTSITEFIQERFFYVRQQAVKAHQKFVLEI